MSMVKVGENESLESALKRFKRKCQRDGIIGDIRKKEAYLKPSVKKKKKQEAARKRARKRRVCGIERILKLYSGVSWLFKTRQNLL